MDALTEPWALFLSLLDMALHLDIHLRRLADDYGPLLYLILFLVVFCETGLVVTPFLPGDSLLFAGGALAGAGILDYPFLAASLAAAAIAGDAVNYRIGKYLGPPIFDKNHRLLRQRHLEKARDFYERHGGKAIVLARFIPIIRTFAPFVAGAAGMGQSRFLFFNIAGALGWVLSLVSAGLFLGSLPFVQAHFSLMVYGIILISLLPLLRAALRRRSGKTGGAAAAPPARPKG
ncbi:MAG: VTT domain-containing protein [Desulfovibrio sp.]|jgi:membrane-associated protein|nr:VTT domain-containing protein [Desulfovibrio sp.]